MAPSAGYLTRQDYMVSRDGERFLLNTVIETSPPMTVILNWKPASLPTEGQ